MNHDHLPIVKPHIQIIDPPRLSIVRRHVQIADDSCIMNHRHHLPIAKPHIQIINPSDFQLWGVTFKSSMIRASWITTTYQLWNLTFRLSIPPIYNCEASRSNRRLPKVKHTAPDYRIVDLDFQMQITNLNQWRPRHRLSSKVRRGRGSHGLVLSDRNDGFRTC